MKRTKFRKKAFICTIGILLGMMSIGSVVAAKSWAKEEANLTELNQEATHLNNENRDFDGTDSNSETTYILPDESSNEDNMSQIAAEEVTIRYEILTQDILPAVDEIYSITITTFDGSIISYSDEEWIVQFVNALNRVEVTPKESVQDIPNVENYGKVDISYNDKVATIFYYTEDGKYYIEQPYQGIYTTDVDIEGLIRGVE